MAVRWYTHIFIHEYKGKYVHSIFNDRDLKFDIGDVQAKLLQEKNSHWLFSLKKNLQLQIHLK